MVQIDIDPVELGRAFPLAAAIQSDARAGLAALVKALSGASADRPEWRASLRQASAAWRESRDRERASDAVPIWPQRVMGELEAVLGPDDVVVCDASLSSGWAAVYLEQRTLGRKVLMPRGQAGLGWSVPAAIGAANADRSHRTVVLVGDGALGYCVGEFATIIEERLPVTVLVLNNRSLGWIRWYSRIAFDRGWQDEDFKDFDYGAVARAYGWQAERVTDPADLHPKLAAALASPVPSLVDLVTETWQTPVAGHRRALEQGAITGYGG